MEKIETLTDAQKARFPEFIKKWTDIGLSTESANRKEAEEGVREAYAIAGLKSPKIVWCDSPLSQGLTRFIVLKFESEGKLEKGAKIGNSVGDSVWDSVGDSVGESVGNSVWDSVGDSVWDSVRDSVGDSVWDSVRDSVWASVRASVWASAGDSVWDSVGDSGYGQHDASWLAFYDFFMEVNELKEETAKLKGLWKIAKNAGWFLPHENICWISERHNELHRNVRGSLHNTRGMALKYPDGWGIYALNGVRFPEELFKKVTSGKMPFKDILAIVDTDQRTQAMRFGDVKEFVKHAKAVELDHHVKERLDGTKVNYWLYRFPKGEVFTEDAYYAVYDDLVPGSDKQYMSGVEPCKTIAEAFAWKFSSEEYTLTPEEWDSLIPGIQMN